VLSVIAQQLLTINQAIVNKLARFVFEGTEIPLNPENASFITMNPGWVCIRDRAQCNAGFAISCIKMNPGSGCALTPFCPLVLLFAGMREERSFLTI
jgi:hypothetical protein